MAGTSWAIDAAHSNVEFAVKHMMLATVKGRFGKVDGTVEFAGDELTSARVGVVVDIASIDTRVEQRDAHLRSPDFFDAASHPEMRFVSRDVIAVGADSYRVTGDLTIRGVTRELVLEASFEGEGSDPWGGSRMAFHATGKLDRRDYGLTWNQALEAGGVLVGETVKLAIDVELVAK
ncbi:MAG: YceI family protein [Gemmatimonadetes bacterium]|nr:YceI family protein [Gemmatimonadota bacterium]